MKHKNSITQIYIERDRKVLPSLIRQAKYLATYPTSIKKLCQIAAELPTEKFYIGEHAAYEYIRKRLLYNITPTFVNPFKQRLFEALYDEVTMMLKKEKYQQTGLINTTYLALNHQAPCVGLTPKVIEIILREPRRQKRQKND